MRRLAGSIASVAVAVLVAVFASTAHGAFGIDEFESSFTTTGSPATVAGSHPDSANTTMSFSTVPVPGGGILPDEGVKDVLVSMPEGFAGDSNAVPPCSRADFAQQQAAACPNSSIVGFVDANVRWTPEPGEPSRFPLYMLPAEPGEAATLGFVAVTMPVFLHVGISEAPPYNVEVDALNNNQTLLIYSASVTVWGDPSSPEYDAVRGICINDPSAAPCSSGIADPRAFITLPRSCNDELTTTASISSWLHPEVWVSAPASSPAMAGCETLAFDPEVSAGPTTTKAASPSGIEFGIEIDDPGLTDPDGIAASDLKKATVTLPEGMTVNPASAGGLGACSSSDVAKESYDSDFGAGCPANSKIGSVEVETPLLEEHLKGSIFLATQHDNPFDALLAGYIVIKSPERGISITLPGLIEADPDTGQLVATFDNNPELPFSKLNVSFKSGSRAPLTTPTTCGAYEITTELTPHSGNAPVVATDTFTIDQGPDGGACLAGDPVQPGDVADSAELPFDPELSAGTTSKQANSHGSFVLNLSRGDADQKFSILDLRMPEGLTAKLAGVSECSDATLAVISDQAGTGAAEMSSPSCRADARIGTATVGAGAGPNPIYVSTGKAYLAGPYKGAPLSLAVVVPALAGPFDLGTTVVRNKLDIDPRTAQVSVRSDPFPQLLHGIPVALKDIRVKVDRPNFMLTGTNCDPLQIQAEIGASDGAKASLTNHFQLSGCGELGFSPKLNLDFGKNPKDTKANAHPQLNAKLSFNEGDANIKSVEVALPQGILLDQERLGRICSRANYAAQTCPEESRVGYAKATTPLLDDPVEGPVYLKASDNPLPDLAADLNGQIDVDLFGRIDQKTNKKGLNQIRNTFDVVPDVPVSDFELTLDGGSDGLLVNSRNLCTSKTAQRLSIEISAHNGYSLSERPLIGSACTKLAKQNQKKAEKLKKKAAKLLKKAKKAKSKKKAKKLRTQARKLKRQAKKLGR